MARFFWGMAEFALSHQELSGQAMALIPTQ